MGFPIDVRVVERAEGRPALLGYLLGLLMGAAVGIVLVLVLFAS